MSNPSDFVIENGVLKKYVGPGGDVTVPEGVTSIGNSAFYWCRSLTSVTIPDGVTSIGYEAFYDCSSLASVTIPEGVTSIGNSAFGGCGGLADAEGFIIVKGVLYDYKGPGWDVVIPDGVTCVGAKAFFYCENLTSVTIPDSVTSIGNEAFYHCSSLASVTIPDGVTSIGEEAFRGCSKLTSVTIPDGVTSIGYQAFYECKSLASVTIPDSVTSIGECVFDSCEQLQKLDVGQKLKSLGRDPFGSTIPEKLHGRLSGLLHALTDASIKNYLLERDWGEPPLWEKLSEEDKLQTYLTRQGKTLLGAYPSAVSADTAQAIQEALVARMTGKASLKDCNTAANFLTTLYEKIPAEGMKELFALLQKEKNGAKAVKLVEGHVPAMEKLGSAVEVDRSLSPAMQKVMEALIAEKKNFKDLEQDLKKMYSMTTKELPKLLSAEGAEEDPQVLAWLLTAHEMMEGGQWDQGVVAAEYKSPGLCPEAEQVVALLDPKSLQEAVRALADTHLVAYQNAKKKFLAYPFCRYADEANMAELTKRAPKWATSVSGNSAPPLWQLRNAVKYSNTRAAMLFAERYGELDEYAKLRGMTEDELRDKYLSDVGLDEQGGKVYDLGSQTVTARLQKDLSFLFELPSGKTAKSLPKKGADPAKYEAAKADFDEMRKAVKKILKSRGAVLFGDFLSGRERESNPWQEAYLKNPLLRMAAGLVVWDQGGKSFTLTDAGAIDVDGQPYTIGETPIKVAHPMEMDAAEAQTWQKYFNARGLKQPFAQVWEPVIDPKAIREDRYKGAVLSMFRFTGMDKHGIHSGNLHAYSEDIGFVLDDCVIDYKASTWRVVPWDNNEPTYALGTFGFKKFTRKVNHIVSILDKWTVGDRVRKDDVTVMELMDSFTLAQITEFIKTAQEANAVNVLALLLEYKNAHFADFDPMDEFTLEW